MHKLFGEILIEKGKINEEQLNQALQLQKDNPERKIGEILVTLNYITFTDIKETLKVQYKLNGKMPPDIEEWLTQEEIDKLLKEIKNE